MKIALVSTGLGRVIRGFESFTSSLYDSLKRYALGVEVTLFQGGRSTKTDRAWVPNLHRYDSPARWFGYDTGNRLEKRSFALALYPILRARKYDIVHYNELVFGSALHHLRRCFGGTYRLLYCNGAPSPPQHYHHRCDFAQMLHGPMYEDAVRFGLQKSRLFLVPYGVDDDRFAPCEPAARQATRQELGVPENAIVVLTVAALNRWHKRIDYLIRETAHLDRNLWLVAAGQRTDETQTLEEEAARVLSGRFRFISWPHNEIHRLYAAADIFVLGSLSEGLPIVLLEAMSTDLPILVHDAPLFRWTAGDSNVRCIDMARQGALTEALASILNNGSWPGARAEALRRFSWENLTAEYVAMYWKIAEKGHA